MKMSSHPGPPVDGKEKVRGRGKEEVSRLFRKGPSHQLGRATEELLILSNRVGTREVKCNSHDDRNREADFSKSHFLT